MKQLLILLITLLYALALALEDVDARYLRKRSSTRQICMKLGNKYGKQTLEVPKEQVGFFTSWRRTNPAKRGACQGNKAVKTLKKRQTKTTSFCRKIRGKLFTTKTIDAATDWMLANGFTEGACTSRNANKLELIYVPPPQATTTTTTTTEAPKKKKRPKTTTTTTTTEKPAKTKRSKGSTTDAPEETTTESTVAP